MTPEAVRETVLAILGTIAPEVPRGEFRPDADLRDELDIDSMDFLRFAIQLEQRLGVSVPEADYPRIRTLDTCVAYLAERGARDVAAGEAAEGAAGDDPWDEEWLVGAPEEEPRPATEGDRGAAPRPPG